MDYLTKIRIKVMVNKKKAFAEFFIRKDYEQIKASVDKSHNFSKEKEFLGEKKEEEKTCCEINEENM